MVENNNGITDMNNNKKILKLKEMFLLIILLLSNCSERRILKRLGSR